MAVAQRMYARALFEAAREAGRVEQVSGDLATFVHALEEVPELDAFLRNPQIDPKGKAEVLGQLTDGGDELVRNFAQLVAERGRGGEFAEMSAELEALVAGSQNRLSVELTTASELSEEDARAIVETIEKASGRQVEATRSVDPSLVGGIVLQVGSHRADGSIRGRLERLRHELATTH